MIGKLFCCFFIIGFAIQASEAKPSFIIIQEYIPKIASSAAKILKTIKHGSEEIAQFENRTGVAVDAADDKINEEINELDQLIQESLDKAKETGTNITSCIDEEHFEFRHINFGAIDDCRTSRAVNHLRVDIMALAKEEISLTVEVSRCIFVHPISGDKLKVCFDSKLQDIDSKIWKFINEADTTIHEAYEKSSICIETYSGNLLAEVDNVMETFKNCTHLF